jgi:cysteine synthase
LISVHTTGINPMPSFFAPVYGLAPCPIQLKLEGVNVAGSIKLKTAIQIIGDLEVKNLIRPGSHLVESSSGNLIILIDEADAIHMCRRLAARGLSVGGSTGSVLHAVSHLADRVDVDSVVVPVSPDMGDKYLATIYSDEWYANAFPRY